MEDQQTQIALVRQWSGEVYLVPESDELLQNLHDYRLYEEGDKSKSDTLWYFVELFKKTGWSVGMGSLVRCEKVCVIQA